MGKIRGWTKSKRTNQKFREIKWDSDVSAVSVSVVFDGAVWRFWLIDVFGGNEEMYGSRDKEAVLKTAKDYMRRNPNG